MSDSNAHRVPQANCNEILPVGKEYETFTIIKFIANHYFEGEKLEFKNAQNSIFWWWKFHFIISNMGNRVYLLYCPQRITIYIILHTLYYIPYIIYNILYTLYYVHYTIYIILYTLLIIFTWVNYMMVQLLSWKFRYAKFSYILHMC